MPNNKMNPEVKSKWVAALRSGEYRQGICFLKRDTPAKVPPTFCCLGVLCDLAEKEGVIKWEMFTWCGADTWYATAVDSVGEIIASDRHSEVLPSCVMRWAGLDSEDPALNVSNFNRNTRVSLINDRDRLGFAAIADLIEGQL